MVPTQKNGFPFRRTELFSVQEANHVMLKNAFSTFITFVVWLIVEIFCRSPWWCCSIIFRSSVLVSTVYSSDSNVNDKERSGEPKKIEYNELQELSDEKSAQYTLTGLSNGLLIDEPTVSGRLHAIRRIGNGGNGYHTDRLKMAFRIVIPSRFHCLSDKKGKSFLWHLFTGDEKWIIPSAKSLELQYRNSTGEPSTSA